MGVFLNVEGMSQYNPIIKKEIQSSACGATTVHVILNHVCANHPIAKKDINELYKLLGSTKIGLFKWRMIRNLRKILGDSFTIEECSISEAILQLRAGYPVAMKFDQYTTFQMFSKNKPMFKYHWTPLIGYEIKDECLQLIIHDNGIPHRPSRIRRLCYGYHQHVLSFVKIEPKE